MTPLADPTTVSVATRLRWAVGDCLALTKRNLVHVRHVPEKLIDVTLQPLMFVLLVAYVFGGAIHVAGGGSYREYLLGGIVVQTLAFAVMGTAVGLADDIRNGVIDRFRSLPMARSAVLAGRALADTFCNLIALAVLVAAGLLVGWRIHGGAGSAIAGFALVLLFSYAMTWAGILLGVLVRGPEGAQGFVFVAMFPLTFLANTFVSTQDLPAGLREVAEWNPISAVVAAVRDLFGNPSGLPADAAWPLEHAVPVAVAWCLAILAVCVPLAVRRYRLATAR
jgi:ABC-2 type transport system permease protein